MIALASLGFAWSWRLGAAFSLSYDEGVYLASARELLHGGVPFRDVFSSQPPLFPWLVRAAFAVGGDTVASGRGLSVVSALIACVAVAALARQLAGPWAAPVAVLLCGCSPGFTLMARTCEAEGPAIALACNALALLVGAAGARRPWRQLVAGALLGLGLSTKILVAPLLAPLLWWAPDRAGRGRVLCAATAVCVVLAVPHGLGAVFDQAVGFHLRALAFTDIPHASMTDLARVVGWTGLLAVSGWAVLWPDRRPFVGIVLWTASAAAFLAAHRPLFSHHLVLLVPGVAVAAAAGLVGVSARAGRLGGAAGAATLALALLLEVGKGEAFAVVEPTAREREAMQAITAHSSPGEAVVSDEQMLVFRADRRVLRELVDTSFVRIGAGSLGPDAVMQGVQRARVITSWTGRLARVPGFDDWLHSRCELLVPGDTPGRGVYLAR